MPLPPAWARVVTGSRVERGDKVGLTPPEYCITRELLRDKGKRSSIILHSLPRMDEIPVDVDITRWSRYWQEAFNGVVIFATNLAVNFDPAFERRIRTHVRFEMPGVDERERPLVVRRRAVRAACPGRRTVRPGLEIHHDIRADT